jgi:hypothetical protein
MAYVETGSDLEIVKVIDGTEYQLLDTQISIGRHNDDYIYDMKFRVENNGDDVDLKVKIWETSDSDDWAENGSEPETWESVTDNGTTGGDPITGAGRYGFHYHLYRNRYIYTDDYSATIIGGGSGAMIPGDLNADGVVNIGDLGILAAAYGQVGDVLGDLNKDGAVNVGDLGILAANYGSSAQGGGVMAVSGLGYTAPADVTAPVDALGSVSGLTSASIIPEGSQIVTTAPTMIADVLSPLETTQSTTEVKTVITDAETTTEDVVDVLSIANLGPFSMI